MTLERSGRVRLENADFVKVIDEDTNEVIHVIQHPDVLPELGDLEDETDLVTSELVATLIRSGMEDDLMIRSDKDLTLSGTEGVKLDSRSWHFSAGSNIDLRSNSSINISTGSFVIDPRALPVGGGRYPGLEPQLKMCVCLPSGLLFTIPFDMSLEKGQGSRHASSCHGEHSPCREDANNRT